MIAILRLIFTQIGRLAGLLLPASVVSAITSGITQFFANRALTVLFGLGLGTFFFVGIERIVTILVADIQAIINTVQSATAVTTPGSDAPSYNYASIMLDTISYAGFFEGLDIILSGYLTSISIIGLKLTITKQTAFLNR